MVIKSISYSQEEIIKDIMKLYNIERFDIDPTYSKGNFYKNIIPPLFKYDLKPQTEDTIQADVKNLPIANNKINSIMFDPPFIVAGPKKEATGITSNRFGYFRNIQELKDFYKDSLKELNRILMDKGFLIMKCQDTVSSGKQYLSHIFIINEAIKLGLFPRDLFVLLAKNRLIGGNHKRQFHARKFHSYFLVFQKIKNNMGEFYELAEVQKR